MTTIHLVSHTHWDREWYLPFQQFRLRLIALMDGLLELLKQDRRYKYFMLDGQTIVLRDYLQMRPQAERRLRAAVKNGRLLIGPWYILPDMFLVGPEAHIRNLLEGERLARQFGGKMKVGYIPDPFGHPAQVPQILCGFDIETACLWRGLDDQPCELWWEAPDGSRVLLAYLRESYSNGASLPTSDGERFLAELQRARDLLLPHAASGHVLIMQGTDHMLPPADTSAAIDYASSRLEQDRLLHSTLPAYIAAIRDEIAARQLDLPIVCGELRSPKRAPLLPGVLSTRMWIKQRNQACETLLTQWAELFSTWASLLPPENEASTPTFLHEPAPILRQAWRLLMECHPHDSICGCSIDAVHDEMRARFDQVEQIGEEITRQSLGAISACVNTLPPSWQSGEPDDKLALVVFNPSAATRTDWVSLEAPIPLQWKDFEIVDENGQTLAAQALGADGRELLNATMPRQALSNLLKMAEGGMVAGMVCRDIHFEVNGNTLRIEAILSASGQPDLARWEQWRQTLEQWLDNPAITTVIVHARSTPATTLLFVAPDIPAYGYRTFWLRPSAAPKAAAAPKPINRLAQVLLPLARWLPPTARRPQEEKAKPPFIIENDFLCVEASPRDGTLTVTDKRHGVVYPRLHRFVDGGDCGDEYNYSPPTRDALFTPRLERVCIERGEAQQTLEIRLRLVAPLGLSANRQARSPETVVIPIVSRITLRPGVARVDIHSEIDNRAGDHRLRVHFPAPFTTSKADFDGHFEVVRRLLGLPAADETWVEQPRPEKPQRAFTAISDGVCGLMIANRGLPEVEALLNDEGKAELALTLLRCVGWLSRDDFSTRRGHAGPMLATPGAQMLGKQTFDYAIIPYVGELPAEQAYAFAAPLRGVNAPLHSGSLPSRAAMLSLYVHPVSNTGNTIRPPFVLSTIKTAEDDKGWIVRGYNLTDGPLSITLKPWRLFRQAERVNLAENRQGKLRRAADGSVLFVAGKHEIVTLRFE